MFWQIYFFFILFSSPFSSFACLCSSSFVCILKAVKPVYNLFSYTKFSGYKHLYRWIKNKCSIIWLILKVDQQYALAAKRTYQPPGLRWESITRSGEVVIPPYSGCFFHFNGETENEGKSLTSCASLQLTPKAKQGFLEVFVSSSGFVLKLNNSMEHPFKKSLLMENCLFKML